jgi:FkbM family methyltransferase
MSIGKDHMIVKKLEIIRLLKVLHIGKKINLYMNIWEKLNISVNDWDSLLRIKYIENTTSGGIFCDVGACNGVVTSLFKGIAGDSGKVYAFELNKYNYDSIKHLESFNCIIKNIAVSDKSEIVDIYADNYNSGNHVSNIVGHDTSFRKMNVIGSINSISLDEYFKEKPLDYLKIDVEGAELKVVKGGIETIKKCKYVIIECHFESDWKDMCELLLSNNLEFKNLVDDLPIYYGDTVPVPGIGRNGMPYQIYLKNN